MARILPNTKSERLPDRRWGTLSWGRWRARFQKAHYQTKQRNDSVMSTTWDRIFWPPSIPVLKTVANSIAVKQSGWRESLEVTQPTSHLHAALACASSWLFLPLRMVTGLGVYLHPQRYPWNMPTFIAHEKTFIPWGCPLRLQVDIEWAEKGWPSAHCSTECTTVRTAGVIAAKDSVCTKVHCIQSVCRPPIPAAWRGKLRLLRNIWMLLQRRHCATWAF